MTKMLIDSLLSVIFPPLCPCCGAVMTFGEDPMCLSCRLKLPLTGFETNPADNEMVDKLQGLVAIEGAVAYFSYRRDAPQAALIHDMKYRGRPSVGRKLAAEYARIVQPGGFFDGVDAIVPVPLNFWRHCRRGYNQSAYIGYGVRDVTDLPLVDALKARRHESQTQHGASERLTATRGVYGVRPGSLNGLKHILLVDDICTTGSTLYACAEALKAEKSDIKISVFTLASTSLI